MIPYGQSYRAPTDVDPGAVMISIAGGAFVGLLSGVIAWCWGKFNLPDFVFAGFVSTTSIVQGVLLGLGLGQIYKLARLRSWLVAIFLSLAFGVLSVFVVREAEYLDYVRMQQVQGEAYLTQPSSNLSPKMLEGARQLAAHPFEFVDRNLRSTTGYDGLLGFIFECNRVGEEIGSEKDAEGGDIVKGDRLWTFWEINALVVLALGIIVGHPKLSAVYCADCKRWYEPPRRFLKIPPGGVGYLSTAIKGNDLHRIVNMQRVPSFNPAEGAAEVALRNCKGCGQYLAEVILRMPRGKHFKETEALRKTSISPELAFAIKAGPAIVPGAEVQRTPPWEIGKGTAAGSV